MNDVPYQPPEYESTAFNCPHCHAFADMDWGIGLAAVLRNGVRVTKEVVNTSFAQCNRCKAWSVWYEEELIHPKRISVEDPNNDLPSEVKTDYIEAGTILQDSPRGATALLRLAVQKLCSFLVEGNDDLNAKIASLVKDGLDIRIQKALDSVRVIGNEAVHPGLINLNDTPDVAHQLFKLVNLIGRRMITEPTEVDAIFNSLPEGKREQIKSRDAPQ